jgi:hypothetical protein
MADSAKGKSMKFSSVLTLNAAIWIAAGIAFAVYGPLMLPYFAIPELNLSNLAYWQIAAFARLFGAALFGAGMLMWALRSVGSPLSGSSRRGVIMALLIGSLFGLIVSAVQQTSIWGMPAGWILTAVFLFFTLAYAALLYSERHASDAQ